MKKQAEKETKNVLFLRYGELMSSLSEGESRLGSHYDMGDKRQCVGL